MISQIERDRAGIDMELSHQSTCKLALAMINAKEYGHAQTMLLELLEKPGHNIETIELSLNLGKCYLGIGEVDQALRLFTKIMEVTKLEQRQEMLPELYMYLSI